MLKVTKSANKSVLEDAVDGDNTAGFMTGQDDYGYVSTEANAFYAKYIEEIKDVKEDKGFAQSRPQSPKDFSGTKKRVKAALTREIEHSVQGASRPPQVLAILPKV
ncbi:protein SPT2 homolog [Eurosta solidaginis]|uniref:protein SPT2 homolog n=1 Tax=Eurosta solidaginis TaxID=178769 RepID=UPI003530E107